MRVTLSRRKMHAKTAVLNRINNKNKNASHHNDYYPTCLLQNHTHLDTKKLCSNAWGGRHLPPNGANQSLAANQETEDQTTCSTN